MPIHILPSKVPSVMVKQIKGAQIIPPGSEIADIIDHGNHISYGQTVRQRRCQDPQTSQKQTSSQGTQTAGKELKPTFPGPHPKKEQDSQNRQTHKCLGQTDQMKPPKRHFPGTKQIPDITVLIRREQWCQQYNPAETEIKLQHFSGLGKIQRLHSHQKRGCQAEKRRCQQMKPVMVFKVYLSCGPKIFCHFAAPLSFSDDRPKR